MISLRATLARHEVGNVVAHLRLPVQLTLAPLYLWGVWGAGGGWSVGTVGAFVAVHLFLYGGATAFNSYYDRDEGPIMGMEHPLPLPAWTAPAALLWQGIGALIVALISAPLLALYLAYAAAGVLYSHPRWRLKGRPYVSTALIFVFQGLGGFTAGWLAGGGMPLLLPGAAGRFVLMGLVAACTTTGFYPLSQVFQTAEDAARGDRTLAMALGPARAFAFTVVALCLAATAGLGVLAAMGRLLDGLLLAVGYAILVIAVLVVGARFRRQPLLATYHRIATVQFCSATFFGLFVLWQLAHPF